MSRQFTIQTTSLGRLFFARNPMAVNVPAPLIKTHEILEGQNVRQRPWDDAQEIELTWDSVPQSFYANLRNYSSRNAEGVVETSYLYDGDLGNFPVTSFGNHTTGPSGTPVKLIDVTGQPITTQYEYTQTGSNPETYTASHNMTMTVRVVRVI